MIIRADGQMLRRQLCRAGKAGANPVVTRPLPWRNASIAGDIRCSAPL
jgi:hypothetical protein